MQIKVFNGFHPDHVFLYERILYLLQPIYKFYPGFEKWYKNVFLPGLFTGERSYITAEVGEKLVGCALIKNTAQEKKICTVFVDSKYRRRGIGGKLFEKALKTLGNKAKLSVSEESLSKLTPLLNKFNFHLLETKRGVYRQGKNELYFGRGIPLKKSPKTKSIRSLKKQKIKD